MRRLLAAAGMLAVVVALVVAPPGFTLASWTSPESGRGDFAALKVPAPVLGATCTLVPGLLGANPVITVTWSLPTGYAFTDIKYGIGGVTGIEVITGGLLGSITTTGGPTAYTTKYGSGLLGGLLGSSKVVGVMTTGPNGWTSGWATATATAGLLGANPTCVVNPPPA